jgi:flagellar biosynthesis chaperone FliJ
MTRSQRMKRIVSLNEMQKSVATQKLTATRGRHDGNLKKLEEFRRYRQEYARALQNPGQAMTAAAARDTRVFLGQLERTITALEAMVTRSERECADDLMAWKREAQRANVLVDILGRCVRNEDADREGQLQREIDDRRVEMAGME